MTAQNNPARDTEKPLRTEDTKLDRLGGRHSESSGEPRDDSSSAGNGSDSA
jgi:hypothetical protein